MRSIRLAIALTVFWLGCFAAAQQKANPPASNAQQTGAQLRPSDPLTVVNCVGAQNGRVPVFTQAAPPNITICNSGIYEAAPYGTGAIGILNPNPIAALDVTGAVNTSLYYQIGGSNVVSIGRPADSNLFLGVGAGANNVGGSGRNVFSGYQAGFFNTAGDNSFFGYEAGYSNATGFYNTFSGSQVGYSNTTGIGNTFSGYQVGYSNTNGYNNTFSGYKAGYSNTTGFDNTFSGDAAGAQTTTGGGNTFYGAGAGNNNTTGSNNIYIGNLGPNSGSESNTIRLGGDNGSGYGPQTAAYIVGVYGSTSSSGIPVYINSNGQLGTSASSLRFKEQVRDMGDGTSALMKLRPVTFLYKLEYANGERTLQYGLIAEEVAKVYPELVAYDKDGQPYAVRYQYLSTMLLNEVQKQAAVIHTQQQEIESLKLQLQGQNASLQERLARLEKLTEKQPQTVAMKEAR